MEYSNKQNKTKIFLVVLVPITLLGNGCVQIPSQLLSILGPAVEYKYRIFLPKPGCHTDIQDNIFGTDKMDQIVGHLYTAILKHFKLEETSALPYSNTFIGSTQTHCPATRYDNEWYVRYQLCDAKTDTYNIVRLLKDTRHQISQVRVNR